MIRVACANDQTHYKVSAGLLQGDGRGLQRIRQLESEFYTAANDAESVHLPKDSNLEFLFLSMSVRVCRCRNYAPPIHTHYHRQRAQRRNRQLDSSVVLDEYMVHR